MNDEKLKLGVSRCLLGESVRYDSGHKRDRFITDILGQLVEFVPVCPEVEIGLPTPREALRLVGDPERPRLVTSRSGKDLTERMETWADKRCRELETENLCGFIFKSGSPSSGMERVKVYTEGGMPSKRGSGKFARAFMDHFPLLPVEDEGRLHDDGLRENFIERIFTLKRWRDEVKDDPSMGKLVNFHTRHKLLILSHGEKIYREMGRLVAHGKEVPPGELYDTYQAMLLKVLSARATVRRQVNTLQHAAGFLKRDITDDQRHELQEAIGRYGDGYVPLIVPITLINHHVRTTGQPYLAAQVYLNPHPVELKLRNHV